MLTKSKCSGPEAGGSDPVPGRLPHANEGAGSISAADRFVRGPLPASHRPASFLATRITRHQCYRSSDAVFISKRAVFACRQPDALTLPSENLHPPARYTSPSIATSRVKSAGCACPRIAYCPSLIGLHTTPPEASPVVVELRAPTRHALIQAAVMDPPIGTGLLLR